jgi:hypothetical protein
MRVEYVFSTSFIAINGITYKLDLGKIDQISNPNDLMFYMHEALHPYVWGMIRDITGSDKIGCFDALVEMVLGSVQLMVDKQNVVTYRCRHDPNIETGYRITNYTISRYIEQESVIKIDLLREHVYALYDQLIVLKTGETVTGSIETNDFLTGSGSVKSFFKFVKDSEKQFFGNIVDIDEYITGNLHTNVWKNSGALSKYTNQDRFKHHLVQGLYGPVHNTIRRLIGSYEAQLMSLPEILIF